jgi:hypothetical protein
MTMCRCVNLTLGFALYDCSHVMEHKREVFVTLRLHCCHIVVTLMLQCRYTVATLLSLYFYTYVQGQRKRGEWIEYFASRVGGQHTVDLKYFNNTVTLK